MPNSKWWSLENIFNKIFDDSKETLKVDISSSPVAMPVDIQATLRQEAVANYTTNLAPAANYTSPAIDASNFRNLVGMWFADQAYSYRIEHSYDGTTWYWGSNGSAGANGSTRITEPIYAKFVRVIIANTGASATTKMFVNFNLFPN